MKLKSPNIPHHFQKYVGRRVIKRPLILPMDTETQACSNQQPGHSEWQLGLLAFHLPLHPPNISADPKAKTGISFNFQNFLFQGKEEYSMTGTSRVGKGTTGIGKGTHYRLELKYKEKAAQLSGSVGNSKLGKRSEQILFKV